MAHFNLNLTEQEYRMLKEAAKFRRVDMSTIVRRGIKAAWLAVKRQQQTMKKGQGDDHG